MAVETVISQGTEAGFFLFGLSLKTLWWLFGLLFGAIFFFLWFRKARKYPLRAVFSSRG